MRERELTGLRRRRGVLRVMATVATILLLPPFLLLAVVPMLLFSLPIALIGLPFILPALCTGTLAARTEDQKRASWKPIAPPLRLLQ
jgi:hypothetical protein